MSIKIEYNLIFMCQMCIRFERLGGFGCAGVWSTAVGIVFAYEFQNYYPSKWARRKLEQINTTFGHSLVQRAMKMLLPMDSRKYGVDASYDQKQS